MSILRVPCERGYRPMVYPRKVLGGPWRTGSKCKIPGALAGSMVRRWYRTRKGCTKNSRVWSA